jgi:glycosyltransferase involved in cell wall biosynthesis
MQLAVLTSTISRKAGGMYESVRHLHRAIENQPPVVVLATLDDFTEEDRSVWTPMDVRTFPIKGPRSLSYSPMMCDALNRLRPDLVHVHGLWQGPSMACVQYHSKNRTPYLVSPRGMLDPWALNNSLWKKRLAGLLFENKHLGKSACLHALCESEANSMRAFGLRNPIAILPNGVTIPDLGVAISSGNLPYQGERKILLFLGRLHPKKGLVNALRAWSKLLGYSSCSKCSEAEGWQFVIAGWDQGGHLEELKCLCRELGIAESSISVSEFLDGYTNNTGQKKAAVVFVGSAFGSEKDRLLRCASAFILPSLSEGLPMSVLEAWSYDIPVLMTDHCNLPEGFSAGAAIRMGIDVDHMAEGIRLLLEASGSEISSLKTNGKVLVEQRFTWEKIARQMQSVYEWLLGGGAPPTCVR